MSELNDSDENESSHENENNDNNSNEDKNNQEDNVVKDDNNSSKSSGKNSIEPASPSSNQNKNENPNVKSSDPEPDHEPDQPPVEKNDIEKKEQEVNNNSDNNESQSSNISNENVEKVENVENAENVENKDNKEINGNNINENNDNNDINNNDNNDVNNGNNDDNGNDNYNSENDNNDNSENVESIDEQMSSERKNDNPNEVKLVLSDDTKKELNDTRELLKELFEKEKVIKSINKTNTEIKNKIQLSKKKYDDILTRIEEKKNADKEQKLKTQINETDKEINAYRTENKRYKKMIDQIKHSLYYKDTMSNSSNLTSVLKQEKLKNKEYKTELNALKRIDKFQKKYLSDYEQDHKLKESLDNVTNEIKQTKEIIRQYQENCTLLDKYFKLLHEKIVSFDKILIKKKETKVEEEVKICNNEEVKDVLKIILSLREQILDKRAKINKITQMSENKMHEFFVQNKQVEKETNENLKLYKTLTLKKNTIKRRIRQIEIQGKKLKNMKKKKIIIDANNNEKNNEKNNENNENKNDIVCKEENDLKSQREEKSITTILKNNSEMEFMGNKLEVGDSIAGFEEGGISNNNLENIENNVEIKDRMINEMENEKKKEEKNNELVEDKKEQKKEEKKEDGKLEENVEEKKDEKIAEENEENKEEKNDNKAKEINASENNIIEAENN